MQTIERQFDMPTFFEDSIESGCFFENTLSGIGELIIDEDFITEMKTIADTLTDDKNLISVATKIYNQVYDYYYSAESNKSNRAQTYEDNLVIGEDGMILGTKISSLKGKNVALCSEKSLAAYTILSTLNGGGFMKRKPELVLTNLSAGDSKSEPHAFVILNSSTDERLPHILFDIENPSQIEDPDGKTFSSPGLYVLSNDEYATLKSGLKCSPISLFEVAGNYHETGDKRLYGQNDQLNR